MINALKEKGFEEGKDFVGKAPEDEHFESAWAKRTPQALKVVMRES